MFYVANINKAEVIIFGAQKIDSEILLWVYKSLNVTWCLINQRNTEGQVARVVYIFHLMQIFISQSVGHLISVQIWTIFWIVVGGCTRSFKGLQMPPRLHLGQKGYLIQLKNDGSVRFCIRSVLFLLLLSTCCRQISRPNTAELVSHSTLSLVSNFKRSQNPHHVKMCSQFLI